MKRKKINQVTKSEKSERVNRAYLNYDPKRVSVSAIDENLPLTENEKVMKDIRDSISKDIERKILEGKIERPNTENMYDIAFKYRDDMNIPGDAIEAVKEQRKTKIEIPFDHEHGVPIIPIRRLRVMQSRLPSPFEKDAKNYDPLLLYKETGVIIPKEAIYLKALTSKGAYNDVESVMTSVRIASNNMNISVHGLTKAMLDSYGLVPKAIKIASGKVYPEPVNNSSIRNNERCYLFLVFCLDEKDVDYVAFTAKLESQSVLHERMKCTNVDETEMKWTDVLRLFRESIDKEKESLKNLLATMKFNWFHHFYFHCECDLVDVEGFR